ncbi:MAG: pilus assembly protein TadG-related protein [Sneathiella sp.]
MKEVCSVIDFFLQDSRGSVSVLFLFVFLLLFGSLALAFDLTRYFTAETRGQKAAEAAILLAARNNGILSPDELKIWVTDFVRADLKTNPFPVLEQSALGLSDLSIMAAEDGGVSLNLELSVPTTLMASFNFFEPVISRTQTSATASVENAEIVILLDRSQQAAESGKLPAMKGAVDVFLAQLNRLKRGDNPLRVGLIPFGNELINIAPRKDWVAEADWPTDLPPAVPGTVRWTGPLEEQRWCVAPRSGVAGENDTPPSVRKFPLVLDIEEEIDPQSSQSLFSITTTARCSDMPIIPLTNEISVVSRALPLLEGHGGNAGGRAMIWAERMLSSSWQTDWSISAGVPANFDGAVQKTVLLVAGTAHSASVDENRLFTETCQRLKTKGVSFHIIDYGAPASMTALYKSCVSSPQYYYRVTDADHLKRRISEVSQSLLTIRITSLTQS